jgi:hypothetical protein
MAKALNDKARRALAATNWDKVDAMTDEDIAGQIASNPDAAPDMAPDVDVRAIRLTAGMAQDAMPNPEMKREAARAKAAKLLAAVTDEEDRTITVTALADRDAIPLDETRLARMRPASAADAADLSRRACRGP